MTFKQITQKHRRVSRALRTAYKVGWELHKAGITEENKTRIRILMDQINQIRHGIRKEMEAPIGNAYLREEF